MLKIARRRATMRRHEKGFPMSRFAFALIALSLAAAPADAARLVHPSAVVKSTENGVAIWRGKAQSAIAPLTLKQSGPCARISVVVKQAYYPPRRLRTHGFWSGDGSSAAYPLTTQGFYADRIAGRVIRRRAPQACCKSHAG